MEGQRTILFINACVRQGSRTQMLAQELLAKLLEEAQFNPEVDALDAPRTSVIEVKLEDIEFPVTDEAFLNRRDALIEAGDFGDESFALARQFAEADTIVIAAPYWDLSFPASLKHYIETINVLGVTFEYTPEGFPKGLCRADKLYYVMTAGGDFVPDEYGFGYIKTLAQNFYGIQEVELIKTTGLDIYGADPEAIIKRAIDEL